MPNKTANYQLNQWEPSDPFLRTDFNEDNAKIDAALAGLDGKVATKPNVEFYQYKGDGETSRTIELGYRPKAVIIIATPGAMTNGFIGVDGAPMTYVQIEETGFTVVKYNNTSPNSTVNTYACIIFR